MMNLYKKSYIIYFCLLGILICSLFPGCSTTRSKVKLTGHPWPGDQRSNITLPEELKQFIDKHIDSSGYPLGYTSEQMSKLGQNKHIIRRVENLFQDATGMPQLSGGVSNVLLANRENFAIAAIYAYILLGHTGAHGYKPPADLWRFDMLSDSNATVQAVFSAYIDSGLVEISKRNLTAWEALPDTVKIFVLKILVAAENCRPIFQQAFDYSLFEDFFETDQVDTISTERLYEFAGAVWGAGDYEVIPRESFETLDRIDMDYLAYCNNIYMQLIDAAVLEFRSYLTKAGELALDDFTTCSFNTSIGSILITGAGVDTIQGDYALVVELGGDDLYLGPTAVPLDLAHPFSTVIDVAGDDFYNAAGETFGLAAGNHGIAGIIDFAGDDRYISENDGLGCGFFGTGFIVDYQGDDLYEATGENTMGAGLAGAGLLLDLSGNDQYCGYIGTMGFAQTLGVGLLMDAEGDDEYWASLDNFPKVWGGIPVSLSLGCSFGRRADGNDGHSLAGGVGMFIEGAGDDFYEAGVFSYGSGYWWGLGLFEECGGNDTYSGSYYSFGGAAHYALGSFVDRTGDDSYNEIGFDKEYWICGSAFGHGRDGSIGICIEGDGDDRYHTSHLSLGGVSLTSIGLFWDRAGNDYYDPGKIDLLHEGDGCFGMPYTTNPNAHHSSSKGLMEIALFLDTNGDDLYVPYKPSPKDTTLAADQEFAAPALQHKAKNNNTWQSFSGPYMWGLGLDTEWYDREDNE